MQICRIKADTEKSHQETLSTTNRIEEVIMENNCIFSGKWEATHNRIDRCLEEHHILQAHVVDLKSLSGPQQTALQYYQDKIAGLEETITQLVSLVKKLKTVCQCHNQLLSPGPHYTPREEEEIVEEEEEEESVRATLPPSMLFADRALLHRGYSISEPNT